LVVAQRRAICLTVVDRLNKSAHCAADTNLDDGPIGLRDDFHEGIDDAAVVKEVLAVLVSAVMRGRHNNSANSSGQAAAAADVRLTRVHR
jgi:hypothetical protein